MYLFIRIERYPGPVSPGPSEIRTDFRCHAYHKSEPFPLQMYYKYHTVAKTALKSGYVPQWGIGTPYLCSVRHTGTRNGIGKGL